MLRNPFDPCRRHKFWWRGAGAQSCKTTFSNELCTSSWPLYSMKPSLRNLFMKKLTREPRGSDDLAPGSPG